MAKQQNNIFKVEGTIYAKPSRTVTSKKDNKDYEFKSIILELKRKYKEKEYIELPEFQLGAGVGDDGFSIGDWIEITFALMGKGFKTWHKTELKALYLRHPDIDGNDTKDVGGSVYPRKKEEFVPPNPYDDKEDDGLPF